MIKQFITYTLIGSLLYQTLIFTWSAPLFADVVDPLLTQEDQSELGQLNDYFVDEIPPKKENSKAYDQLVSEIQELKNLFVKYNGSQKPTQTKNRSNVAQRHKQGVKAIAKKKENPPAQSVLNQLENHYHSASSKQTFGNSEDIYIPFMKFTPLHQAMKKVIEVKSKIEAFLNDPTAQEVEKRILFLNAVTQVQLLMQAILSIWSEDDQYRYRMDWFKRNARIRAPITLLDESMKNNLFLHEAQIEEVGDSFYAHFDGMKVIDSQMELLSKIPTAWHHIRLYRLMSIKMIMNEMLDQSLMTGQEELEVPLACQTPQLGLHLPENFKMPSLSEEEIVEKYLLVMAESGLLPSSPLQMEVLKNQIVPHIEFGPFGDHFIFDGYYNSKKGLEDSHQMVIDDIDHFKLVMNQVLPHLYDKMKRASIGGNCSNAIGCKRLSPVVKMAVEQRMNSLLKTITEPVSLIPIEPPQEGVDLDPNQMMEVSVYNYTEFLFEKMFNSASIEIWDIVPPSVKEELTSHQISLDFPPLYSSNGQLYLAYKMLYDALETGGQDLHQTIFSEICNKGRKSPVICRKEGRINPQHLIHSLKYKLREFDQDHSANGIAAFIKNEDYLRTHYHLMKEIWNVLTHKGLIHNKVSEWVVLKGQVTSGNPWASMRLSYLWMKEELKKNVSSSGMKYFDQLMTLLGLNKPFQLNHASRILNDYQKKEVLQGFIEDHNDSNHNIFITQASSDGKLNYYDVFKMISEAEIYSPQDTWDLLRKLQVKGIPLSGDVDNLVYEVQNTFLEFDARKILHLEHLYSLRDATVNEQSLVYYIYNHLEDIEKIDKYMDRFDGNLQRPIELEELAKDLPQKITVESAVALSIKKEYSDLIREKQYLEMLKVDDYYSVEAQNFIRLNPDLKVNDVKLGLMDFRIYQEVKRLLDLRTVESELEVLKSQMTQEQFVRLESYLMVNHLRAHELDEETQSSHDRLRAVVNEIKTTLEKIEDLARKRRHEYRFSRELKMKSEVKEVEEEVYLKNPIQSKEFQNIIESAEIMAHYQRLDDLLSENIEDLKIYKYNIDKMLLEQTQDELTSLMDEEMSLSQMDKFEILSQEDTKTQYIHFNFVSKAPLYKYFMKQAISKRKQLLSKVLGQLCSFDEKDEKQRKQIIYGSAKARKEVHEMFETEEPKIIKKMLTHWEKEEWESLWNGLGSAGLLLASIGTAGIGAPAIVVLSLAFSAMGTQIVAAQKEFELASSARQRYGDMSDFLTLGLSEDDEIDELNRGYWFFALESAFTLPLVGHVGRGMKLGWRAASARKLLGELSFKERSLRLKEFWKEVQLDTAETIAGNRPSAYQSMVNFLMQQQDRYARSADFFKDLKLALSGRSHKTFELTYQTIEEYDQKSFGPVVANALGGNKAEILNFLKNYKAKTTQKAQHVLEKYSKYEDQDFVKNANKTLAFWADKMIGSMRLSGAKKFIESQEKLGKMIRELSELPSVFRSGTLYIDQSALSEYIFKNADDVQLVLESMMGRKREWPHAMLALGGPMLRARIPLYHHLAKITVLKRIASARKLINSQLVYNQAAARWGLEPGVRLYHNHEIVEKSLENFLSLAAKYEAKGQAREAQEVAKEAYQFVDNLITNVYQASLQKNQLRSLVQGNSPDEMKMYLKKIILNSNGHATPDELANGRLLVDLIPPGKLYELDSKVEESMKYLVTHFRELGDMDSLDTLRPVLHILQSHYRPELSGLF